MVQLYDVFSLMHEVREAIKQHVLDESESYKTIKFDKHQFVIGCKDSDCMFRI